MSRSILASWSVGGILLLLAGCAPAEISNFLLFASTNADGDRVVVGSLETVSQGMQSSLTQLGLVVSRTDSEGAIHLTGASKTGARFTLVLTREQSSQGERTRVRVQWDGGRDEQTHVQIMARVDSQGQQGSR